MALTVAAASAQAMGAALATDIGSGAIIEIRSGAKPPYLCVYHHPNAAPCASHMVDGTSVCPRHLRAEIERARALREVTK